MFTKTKSSHCILRQGGKCAADALRVFILHRYGGLYLDGDVECIAPVDPMLEGYDLVLQLEDKNAKSLNNGVMASVPDMPFWRTVMALFQQRCCPSALLLLTCER